MVLKMMVLSETVVVLVIHKACEKITFDPIVRGFGPDSVSALLKIIPVNLH